MVADCRLDCTFPWQLHFHPGIPGVQTWELRPTKPLTNCRREVRLLSLVAKARKQVISVKYFSWKKKWCAKSVFPHTNSNSLKLTSFTDTGLENVCTFPVPCPAAFAPCLLQCTLEAGSLNSSTCTSVSCLHTRISLKSLELGMLVSQVWCSDPFLNEAEQELNLSLLLCW